MITDMHTHAFPDKIALGAVKTLAAKANIPPYTNGTLSDTDEKMREWGIDRRVMLSIATNPRQQHNVNSFAIETNSDTVIAFGSVHPNAPDALDELGRIHEAGLVGVKLHPEYQDFYIDDKRLFPIYDKCSELGLITVFHAGLDLGFKTEPKATPKRCKSLLENFPKAKFIFAHMGGASMSDEVLEYLAGKNCWFDTAFSRYDLKKETAEKIISRHGAEKILFGSDCPWERACDSVEYIDALDISDDKKEMIYSKNAADLLGF